MDGAPRIAVLAILLLFALFLAAVSMLVYRWPGGGKMALSVAFLLVGVALAAGSFAWYFGIFG